MCCECSRESQINAWERRGLKRVKALHDKSFCWQCWYRYVAFNGLYRFDARPRDYNIAYQMYKINEFALKRLESNADFEIISQDELMALIMTNDGACSVSGKSEHLTFDHIMPLAIGGGHVIENLRAVTLGENLRAEAIILRQWHSQGLDISKPWRENAFRDETTQEFSAVDSALELQP
jgi:hypothetical protein